MKIEYSYSTDVTVFYDDTFEQHLGNTTLDNVKNTILFNFGEHWFTKGIAIDTATGEVLLSINLEDEENDENYEPAYYDDGDTCGYE